jgi:hypothetical protein
MATPLASVVVCSICNEPLTANLACLLRAGLDEPDKETVSFDSLGFGDFEVARREDGSFWELGCGAMGVTYRATDKVLHRTVALKVIEVPASAGDSQTVRERFLREARSAAALMIVDDCFPFTKGFRRPCCKKSLDLSWLAFLLAKMSAISLLEPLRCATCLFATATAIVSLAESR